VDDCFLFFKGEEWEAQVMKTILETYELASGQTISVPKFELFFSRTVPTPLKDAITNILGVRAAMESTSILAPSL